MKSGRFSGSSVYLFSKQAGDGGLGYLEGRCDGNTLKMYLHNSKTVEDFSEVQWAAAPSDQWANRVLHSCDDAHCRIADNGKTIEISIPDSHGQFLFPTLALFLACPVRGFVGGASVF